MAEVRDWGQMKAMSERLLKERTGQDMAAWNERIRKQGFENEDALRAWLTERGVTGYAANYLIMERFGYPDFLTASAADLIDGQYADRPTLRPILDALLKTVEGFDDAAVQARKTYVSLVTPRRTFARIQATTKDRVDLALRLEGVKPGGRLVRSRVHESTPVQISFSSVKDVDAEARRWLRRAYEESR